MDTQSINDKNYREKVYKIVRAIPPGRVMTYGQIAAILGEGYTARTVGFAMNAIDSDDIPWQRVINSQGKCSTEKLLMPHNVQQKILEEEGVIFVKDKVDLKKYGWKGPDEADEPRQETLF